MLGTAVILDYPEACLGDHAREACLADHAQGMAVILEYPEACGLVCLPGPPCPFKPYSASLCNNCFYRLDLSAELSDGQFCGS